jgi:phenylalanyl-tRNA synthetase beta chain
LPHELPTRSTQAAPQSSLEALKRDVRDALAAAGNNELQTYSFIAARLLEKTGQDTIGAYRVRNALSPELELVRTSLLPSLLDKVHANHKAGYDAFGLFEIGKSHNKYDIITDPKSLDDQLPKEHLGLSYIFSAERKAASQWQGAPFYQAKHELGYLLDVLKFERCTYAPLAEAQLGTWWLKNIGAMFEPKRAALVSVDGVAVGILGEFTTSLKRNFKLPDFVAGFEVDLGLLHGIARPTSTYQPLLRFPMISQDICFKVSVAVNYGQLEELIVASLAADQRLRVRINPVDAYQRPDQPELKQLTYGITLQHHDKTLTTEAVNSLLDHVAKRAKQEFGAERV